MTSAFFGLKIASSALSTAQTQVNIANQNIANANTPGYSRQAAVVTASSPYPIPAFGSSGVVGQLGTGVQITAVNRARDTFIDAQIRGQLSLQGQADAHSAALTQVEATVNEPSTTGLSSTLTAYWSAWQEVANTPSDSSIRANVVEAGTAVADVFKSTVTQFKQQQQNLDSQVAGGVSTINADAKQIATLNLQIAQVESTGMQANDLRDQRDLVVDKLSSLVKITTSQGADGQLSINVGNHQLVDRGSVHTMVASTSAGSFAQVQWSSETPGGATTASDNVNLGGGQMQGLIDSRDQILQQRIDDVNTLATRVIQSVNSLNASGVALDGTSGHSFFSGTNATDMAVDSNLTTSTVAAARMVADPTSATGYSYATGDSSNAIALAQLGSAIAQPNASSGSLAPGQSLAPATVLGVDLSGASANTTYTFNVTAGSPPTVSVNDGTTVTQATLTMGVDGAVPPNNIISVDAGSTRLTLSAAGGTTLSAALSGLNGKTIATAPAPSTIGGEYAQQVASLGNQSQAAKSQSSNQGVLVSNLTSQRDQLSGVSLDEETVNLMMYQKAYQAAARVITVMDGMLDTLINHMGTG